MDIIFDVADTASADTGYGFGRLNVLDGNDSPHISLSNVTSTLPENRSTTQSIKVADIFVVDDVLGTNVITLTGTDAGFFDVVNNAGSLELHVRAGTVLNFETKPTYSLNVIVDDVTVGNTPDDSTPYSLTLTDVNDPPSLIIIPPVNDVYENVDTTNGYHICFFSVADEDPTTSNNQLALSGSDAALFEIVGTEIRLVPGALLDFETQTSLHVNISVDDPGIGLPGTAESTVSLTILILDVNDTRPTVAAGQVVNIPEESALNSVHELIGFTDPDTVFTSFTWRIDGAITDGSGDAQGGLFAGAFGLVNATDGLSGAVRILNPAILDFDSSTLPKTFILHSVVVRDNQSGLESLPVDVNVSITDVNDNPPVISAIPPILIPENAALNSVYGTISGTDIDTVGSYSWSITGDITGNDGVTYNGLFGLVSTGIGKTATVRVLNPALLDFDLPPTSYTFLATLFDGIHSVSATATVQLTDVNDIVPVIVQPNPVLTVSESAANDQFVGDLDVFDPDTNNNIGNWTIVSGNADGVFKIDPTTGIIRIASNTLLDFETMPSYLLTVTVFDGVNTSLPTDITINVLNVVEPAKVSVRIQNGVYIPDNTGSVNYGVWFHLGDFRATAVRGQDERPGLRE